MADKKTALYDEHVKLKARIVPFGGFLMPVQYAGILEEHRAVREKAGIFDLSHMGEFWVRGPKAISDVNHLVTNDVTALVDGQALYTPMCTESGTIVDDLLVYRVGPEELLLVVNASNIDKDYAWVRDHLSPDTRLENRSDETGLIAVQGPEAVALVETLVPGAGALGSFRFLGTRLFDVDAIVSRTGYTGEDGFEIYLPASAAARVWNHFVEKKVAAIGLGARDTLRFEARLPLYGNDIDDTTTPLEAGIGWTVKWKKPDFIGKKALAEQKEKGLTRQLVGFKMMGRQIARHGFDVFIDEKKAGVVTSGTFSPTLESSLGLAYVPVEKASPGSVIGIMVRGKVLEAEVVKTPFYTRKKA